MDKKSVFFKKEYQIKNLQRAGTKVPPPPPPPKSFGSNLIDPRKKALLADFACVEGSINV
jgi:hypothetical protein